MAADTARFDGSATIFVVKNVLDSVAYYRDRLGFEIAFTYGEPVFYAGVCRGGITIHLSATTKRQVGQGGLNVFVPDVDGLHDEFRRRGAVILKPPQNYDYGMRDFDVADPDGNYLCFGMEVPAKP